MTDNSSGQALRVVIVGGGFGGLRAAQRLKRTPVSVTLIDRHNYHLFQPLLYQVATGGLSPANIASPLRDVLKRQQNARVLWATVRGIDVQARTVDADGLKIDFDCLLVATGNTHNYFGHADWAAFAPGLKTLEDATRIRARIISAFEAAEREADPARLKALLTFVVIGGGPTGVELAGAVAELARDSLRHEFRAIAPESATVILVEAADRILMAYPQELSQRAQAQLEALGVTVRTGCSVQDIRRDELLVHSTVGTESISACTMVWSAGMRATGLGALLHQETGVELDRSGRVMVSDQLEVPGHLGLFVIGDLAHVRGADGAPLPATAPVALQEGEYVARLIEARLSARNLPAFRFRDRGQLATIGRSSAVAIFPHFRLWGWPAWVIWLFVHLMQLVRHENRVLVFVQWMFNYITRNRGARLITDYSDSSAEQPLSRRAPGT
jgi:NADH dehydrogenase